MESRVVFFLWSHFRIGNSVAYPILRLIDIIIFDVLYLSKSVTMLFKMSQLEYVYAIGDPKLFVLAAI